MSNELYPDGDYTFVAGGGASTDGRGKTHWPALLRLEMDRHEAWRMVYALLRRFETNDVIIDYTLSGRIQRQDEEGNPVNIDGGTNE